MKKGMRLVLLAMLLILLLGGCAAKTIDEMYALPRRSERNNNLRTVIESAMDGSVYAAPFSGANQESVQAADLDGDGREEYLIFTKSSQGDVLQILIIHQLENENFELWETIECKGAAFEQVQYADIDGIGGSELIVGTQLTEKVTRTVAAYSFASGQSNKIKSMVYVNFLVCDLDADGRSELMIVQGGNSTSGNAVARLYRYSNGTMSSSPEAMLSVPPEYIQRMTVNTLSSGEPAVYIAGAFLDNVIVTDILALKENVFTNVVRTSEIVTSMQPLHNNMVFAEDLDGDGILELPSLLNMMYNTTEQNLVRWFSVDIDGQEANKLYTFHNFDDGWYIQLQSEWIDRLAAEKTGSTYTFLMWNNSYGTAVPVFTIYTLTGKDRDSQAATQNRFALYRGEDAVYAAKLESGSAIYGMTESYLQENFHLIRQEWNASQS